MIRHQTLTSSSCPNYQAGRPQYFTSHNRIRPRKLHRQLQANRRSSSLSADACPNCSPQMQAITHRSFKRRKIALISKPLSIQRRQPQSLSKKVPNTSERRNCTTLLQRKAAQPSSLLLPSKRQEAYRAMKLPSNSLRY